MPQPATLATLCGPPGPLRSISKRTLRSGVSFSAAEAVEEALGGGDQRERRGRAIWRDLGVVDSRLMPRERSRAREAGSHGKVWPALIIPGEPATGPVQVKSE